MADMKHTHTVAAAEPRSPTPTDSQHTEKGISVPEDTQQPTTSENSVRAWLVVLGACLASFCTSGALNAYGIFQEYYAAHQLHDKSAFSISWIGSFCMCALFLGAGGAGVVNDKFGPTVPMTIGAVGTVLAVFMVSLCKEYYQFFLAQGVFLGGSMGFLITPSIATLSQHFVRHRGITTGIAISGSSLGGVIWPIAINQLLNHKGVSFGWTMRIMGFMMMPLVAFAVLAVRLPKAKVVPISEDGTGAPTKPAKKKKTDLSFVKSPTFILFAIGLIIYYLAFSGPMFFTPSYAVEVLHSSSSFAFYTLAILNAASMFGRILPGLLADYFGNFNICALAAVVSGVVSFCWTAADTEGGLVAWSLAYGFASGAMLSLQMTCIAQISNPEARGTSMGLIMMSTSLAILFGSPIAGKLTEHGYIAISMYCGACLVLGGLLIWLARLRLNKKLFAKV